jgi:solute carrier family 25 phosphate transporter 23/24/25/41
LSYYQNSVTLNAEGDTSISEETLEGLGRAPNFLEILFGVIIQLAQPPKAKSTEIPFQSNTTGDITAAVTDKLFIENSEEVAAAMAPTYEAADDTLYQDILSLQKKKILLTDILPDPGYFAAGAVAGVVSRTSTAPLDRLKVYLIANIGNSNSSIDAAKRGDAVTAAKKLGQPLIDAVKDLWKAGGMRSLFAGEFVHVYAFDQCLFCRKWTQRHQGYARISYKIWCL